MVVSSFLEVFIGQQTSNQSNRKAPRLKNIQKKIPYHMVRDWRHLSVRTAGSHNCSRSAPALQLNVDLLSAKGS